MKTSKLNPILTKESILKTANLAQIRENPQDVLQRYESYANTHVPLGDTTKQLQNLERVIVQNKTCAVGTIVGPYGYGKTSTAVHLWYETRAKKILSIPPFVWITLEEFMDVVYLWMRFEFEQGPAAHIPELEGIYKKYQQGSIEALSARHGIDTVRELREEGLLKLNVKPENVVQFLNSVCLLAEKAGFKGLVVYTDELQVTLSNYSSRDAFFSDLFDIVRDILGTPGHWAMVLTMNEDIEGTISRLRSDLLQRLQYSALHFRVKDLYNRRDFPRELWESFEKRFDFDGSGILLIETLDAMGQIAAREDLGAGPRMVTQIMSLGIKHYEKTGEPYTPLHMVEDFLTGLVSFDQRGKFSAAVKKALENLDVKSSVERQRLIKLLAAYPAGCSEVMMKKYDVEEVFRTFPPMARRELLMQVAEGYILRYLSEQEAPPEQIEQRLTKEFVSRFSPNRQYALLATKGFLGQFLLDMLLKGWENGDSVKRSVEGVDYISVMSRGTFDVKYPDRSVHVMVTAVPQSTVPVFKKINSDAELEYRFELNYELAPSEPSRILIDSLHPEVVIFQLNIRTSDKSAAIQMIPEYLFEYYDTPEKFTPLLCLSLIEYMYQSRGDLQDDRSRVASIIQFLRQFSISLLLGQSIEMENTEFANGMVGVERIKELFRTQCRRLYPDYKTLNLGKNWQTNIQQYRYAVERVINEDGISIARGRNEWKTTKNEMADAMHIPGKSMARLEVLVKEMADMGLLEIINFSGRQVYSDVSFKFKLHPLESDWLILLDESKEHHSLQGVKVQAITPELLFARARKMGYTEAEQQEVMQLMRARKYIDLEPKKNLLYRTMDTIDSFKENVQTMLSKLESDVRDLSEAIGDFDDKPYMLLKVKSDLESAKERDQVEQVRDKIREWEVGINAFVNNRSANIRERITRELEKYQDLVRNGIPLWMNYQFEVNPLQDVLEKQRSSRVQTYQNTLDEIRKFRESVQRVVQESTSNTAVNLIKLNDLKRDFIEKGDKLIRKIESFKDEQSDMEAWRSVVKMINGVNSRAGTFQQTYDFAEFNVSAQHLWKTLREEFEQDPLSVFSHHEEALTRIGILEKRINDWEENRRKDFAEKCQAYQSVLKEAGMDIDLKVPFDAEHPSDSHSAFHKQVHNGLQRYLTTLDESLTQAATTIRYAIKVQKLKLQTAETQVQHSLLVSGQILNVLTFDTIEDFDSFKDKIVLPLTQLATEEYVLRAEVQNAIKKRSPEGSELRLMQMLDGSIQSQRVDLRGLIIKMLENSEDEVDLNELMRDVTALFKKNQISVYIVAQGEEKK